MRQYKNHISTHNSLVLIFNDGTIPILNTNKHYVEIKEAIKNRDFNTVIKLADYGSVIKSATKGDFSVKDGEVVCNGKALPIKFAAKLKEFIENKIPCDSLKNFWENLRRNPSMNAREELFNFLENNGIPITQDGCFIGYKKVKDDFKDWYTGTINSSPGKIVSIARQSVDPDCNRTCSYGLHVGCWDYANTQYHAGEGKMVQVKVNPRHVVSVPTDYNGQKMRVCQYEVQCVVKEPCNDIVYNSRTYYYTGKTGNAFDPRKVTSHKPNRFVKTCRAKTTEEAIKEFQS